MRSVLTTRSGLSVALFAHRGLHQVEPENTLAAFQRALEAGVDGIELDVRQAACGTLICFHDPYTRRLTGQHGRVRRLKLGQLLALRVQNPVSGRGRPIATLDEALALLSDSLEIILDLKQEGVRSTHLERDTVALLRRHGLCESIVISSFNPWVLRRTRKIAPEFRTALIAGTKLALRLFNPAYCDALHVRHSLLNGPWPRYRVAPSRLILWTVDRKSELPRPLPDSVRGVISNDPRRLRPARSKSPSSGRLA
jgi:glycerophosphoryl diester phosphodiesterase